MNWCAVLLLSAVTATTENWPGFLGAGAGEINADVIATDWSPDKNIAWQAKLPGYGQSTAVVFDEKVFVTSVEGPMKDRCVVVGLNLADGKQLWRHDFENQDKRKSNVYVSRAAPTPVADESRVFCFFESGDLVCLDHDGEKIWDRNLAADYGKIENRFCLGGSPAQDADHVYILVDHDGPSYLIAINKSDGKTHWKSDRDSRISWSSPALMEIDGEIQIVVSSAGSIDGYDPANGELLWTVGDLGGNTATTPISAGDGRILIGAGGGRSGETAGAAAKTNGLISVKLENGKHIAEHEWFAKKALSSFGSPIAFRGLGYWVNRSGVVYCFDLATGEAKYSERLDDSCWATPVGIGDRIYFFGRAGSTTVIAAGPEFKKLASNRLWNEAPPKEGEGGGRFGGRVQYGASVVGNSLLVRTGDILYCVRK